MPGKTLTTKRVLTSSPLSPPGDPGRPFPKVCLAFGRTRQGRIAGRFLRYTAAACAVLALLASAARSVPADEGLSQPADSTDQRLSQLEAELSETRARLACLPDSSCDAGCQYCEPGASSGFYGGAALVFAKPHFKESFQASHINGLTGSLDLLPFSYDYSPTPRTWLGYVGRRGLGVRGVYWQYDQAGDSRALTSDGVNIYGANATTIIFPATILADDPGETLITTDGLEVHVVDLEGTMRAKLDGLDVVLAGGLRYVSLNQSLSSSVVDALGVPQAQLAWTRRFDGVGPVVYVDGKYQLGCTGFSVLGQGGGALLFGDKKLDRFVFGGIPIGGQPPAPFLKLDDADEVVGMGEVRLGAEWARELVCGGRFYVQGMYEAQLWAEAGAPTLGFLGFESFSVSVGLDR